MIKIKVICNNLAVVTETPNASPLGQFMHITNDLMQQNFKGKVIFDLLISKGTNERFVEAEFDGCRIIRSSLKVKEVTNVPEQILNSQNEFFSVNKRYLYNSVLTKQELQLFR